MFNRHNAHTVDTSLFDPEEDMDLVIMIDKARTEGEIQSIARMSRARMKARRAAVKRSATADATATNGRRGSLLSRRRAHTA